jgi:uncharacterized OsmC-like protein
MTIMGIYAREHALDITGTEIEITKRMSDEPRRVGEIDIIFHMPDREFTIKDKTILERVAHTCPVHLSLSEEVRQNFTFRWRR